MIKVIERPDGTRRVQTVFSDSFTEKRFDATLRKEVDYFPDRSKTRAEFAKDTDIKRIVAKYRKTGILGDPLNYGQGMYGDFSGGDDFAAMMRKIVNVQTVFNDLPSNVRSRFQNDPGQMIDFLVDPANDAEAVKLGLKIKPPAPEVEPDPPVPAPAPAAPVA